MFKNKLTAATGSAIEIAHTFGINNIGKKPIGYDSLWVSTPLLHSIINFSMYSGLLGFDKFFLLKV